MKSCKECEYFQGFDYEDGTPHCSYKSGFEDCPYNVEGGSSINEFKLTLDIPEIKEFVRHTIGNTLENAVHDILEREISKLITDEIKEKAKEYVDEALKEATDKEVKEFFGREITIGGGWREPDRTITRNEYLAECVSKVLDEKLKPEAINKLVRDYCESSVNRLKDDINRGIKQNFDDATRKALSDNVVSMLMCGDTYKRLSDSMSRLIK